ncbi:MAG: hypothetical protein JNK76_25965 [Planctomycetales bacterium]|nr:hypothetical protein [Planctomycetales bacterium]MBN8624313.1 hypothetical protein [Planctomycetota bacterium]
MNWKTTIISLAFMSPLFVLLYVSCVPHLGSKPTRVIVEIGQLHTTFQAYKERAEAYPPCLADVDPVERKLRFMKHLAAAYPNAEFEESTSAFDRLNDQVQNGQDGGQGYNFVSATGGQAFPLDLNRLDAAEAIVFWLGGFPTPVRTTSLLPVANRRIFGFHRDADAPFRRDALAAEGLDALRYRTEPMYQFDETRLVDYDGDGWWEYASHSLRGDDLVPPIVYFDSETYVTSSKHADNVGLIRYPNGGSLGSRWGCAAPYLKTFDPQNPLAATWINPEGFQLQTGGDDQKYSLPMALHRSERRVLTFPDGEKFGSLDGKPFERLEVDAEEQDNLSNTSNLSYGAAVKEFRSK